MEIVTLVFGLLLLAGSLAYLIYVLRGFKKSARPALQKKEKYSLIIAALGLAIGVLLIQVSVNLYHPSWKNNATYSYPLYATMAYLGIFGFILSNVALWVSFFLYYYKANFDPKERKFFRYLTFAAIPFAVGFALLWTQGIAPYITYPLVSGFSINSFGFQWTRGSWAQNGDFHVAFYALTMLFGVCVCYWISDHRFYKEYHKHGILDNLAIFAFLCGVIGARVWYVVGNWTRDGFADDPSRIWQIWNGGLTILGGALGGVIGGVLFMVLRRKYVNIRWAMDIIIPTILLAQSIGRWGNFLNCEVYGVVVNISDGWGWLPLFIQKQMGVGLAAGQIHVPLFLIEGFINLVGYFLIAWGVGKGLKKYLAKGDLAGLYFLWYGIVRIFLEPLRDSAYNMGGDNEWSIWSSLIYIIIGIGLIVFSHLLDLQKKKVGGDLPFFLTGAACLVAAALTPLLSGVKGIGYTTVGSSDVILDSVTENYQGFALIFGGGEWKPNAGLIIGYLLLIGGLGFAIYTFVRNRQKALEKSHQYYAFSSGILLGGTLMFLLATTFLGLHYGTADFGGLTNATVNYNLGPGFLLTICLSLIAASLFFIPLLNRPKTVPAKETETPTEA